MDAAAVEGVFWTVGEGFGGAGADCDGVVEGLDPACYEL